MVNSLSCVCLALLQQEFLQEHHTANVSILPLSDVGPSSPSLPSSSSRILRGFGGEESRLSRLALLLRGQSHERRLPLAAREARDRLEERLRAAALVPPRLVDYIMTPSKASHSPFGFDIDAFTSGRVVLLFYFKFFLFLALKAFAWVQTCNF